MKLLRLVFFSFSLFILFSSFSPEASSDWILQKNENGITVYTRYTDGSKIKEVRVVNIVSSSLSGLVALLLDTRNYPQWIYGCSESKALKIISEKELYNYQVTDVPWPFTDRDVVSDFKVAQDSVTKIVKFTKSCLADFLPEKNDMVRIQKIESSYTLTPLGHGNVQVIMQMSIDPGGNVPAWFVNYNLVVAPYKTTEAMIVQLPQYQSASYSFIQEN